MINYDRNKRLCLSIVAFIFALCCKAQTVMVIDEVTRQPVAHASLYTRSNGKFRSAVTDIGGKANVDFAFSRLTVSHLNYKTKVIRTIADTIFLEPKEYMTAEVKVTNKEPEWIRRKLRAFVKVKDDKYFSKPRTSRYVYTSRSIGKRRFYQYAAEGLLAMRNSTQKLFCVRPLAGTVMADDTTRLTDTQNLRRMLYEDFVTCLDKSFIRDHHFAVDTEYKGKPDEVRLIFWTSDKNGRDQGNLVMDTLRLTVSSVTRHEGLDYNKRTKVSATMLRLNWLLSGYKILVWDVDYHCDYADCNGFWQPTFANYKFFYDCRERTVEKKDSAYYRDTGNGFTNIESSLRLSSADSLLASNDTLMNGMREAAKGDTTKLWLRLPRSWYMRLSSDLDRREEIRLAHLPSVWRKPEESF